MKIVSFIGEAQVIEKILRHCEFLARHSALTKAGGKSLRLDHRLLCSTLHPFSRKPRSISGTLSRTARDKSHRLFKLSPEATRPVFFNLTKTRRNGYIKNASV